MSADSQILPVFRGRQVTHCALHSHSLLELCRDVLSQLVGAQFNHLIGSGCDSGEYRFDCDFGARFRGTGTDVDVLEFCHWIVDLQYLG